MRKILLILFILSPLTVHAAAGKTNHVGIFGGATTFFDPSGTYFTAGADYEYVLGSWGVGAFVDLVFSSKTKFIGGPAIFLHPVKNLNFYLSPAIESYSGNTYFGGRASVNYTMYSGGISIGPSVSADYFNSHLALVYGLVFGFGF